MFKHLEEKITDNGIKLNDRTIQFGEAEMHDQKVKTLPVREFLDFYNIKYICGYIDLYESGYKPKQNKRKLFPCYQLKNNKRIFMRLNDFDTEDKWKEKTQNNKRFDARHSSESLNDKVKTDDHWARYDYYKQHGKSANPNKKFEETTYTRQVSLLVDCKEVYEIDFDTEKDKIDSEIFSLLQKLPYTRSTTKAYGRHIFFTDSQLKKPKKRQKIEFLEKYAYCMNEENTEKSGADFLTNWAIVKANEVVFNADKLIRDTIPISNYLKTEVTKKKQNIEKRKAQTEKQGYIDISNNLNGMLHIEDDSDDEEPSDYMYGKTDDGLWFQVIKDKDGNVKKTKDGKTKVKMVYHNETDDEEEALIETAATRDDAYYKTIKENLTILFSNSLKNHDYDTTAGWIMRCADSKDVIVKNILHDVLDELDLPWRARSRPNAPDGHDFIEEKWNAYFEMDKEAQKGYKFTYGETLSFKPTEIDLATFFLQVYNNTFLYNEKDSSFYVFEGEYSANESRVKSIFWTTFPLSFLELCKETYKELPYYIVKLCEEGKYNSYLEYRKNFNTGDNDTDHKEALKMVYQDYKKKRDTFINKYTEQNKISGMYSMVKTMLPSKKFNMINRHMDYNEESKYKFHFKNGCYNFKLDKFVARTSRDYVTKVLDYNYKEVDEVDGVKEKMKEIKEMIKKIHPNKDERDFFMRWTGYCLTGYTNLQKFLYNVGKKAGNGKSTLTDIGCSCFPLYWTKMDSKVFNKDNATADKTLQRLIDNPYRRIWLEEVKATKDAIDINKLKDFTAGGSKTIKPMYKKEVCLNDIHAKFEINTNYEPNHPDDKGIARRGITQYYNSLFKQVKKDDFKKHIYKADGNLVGKFDKTVYKLAYFHVFKKYAVECVENKGIIKIPPHLEANFKKLNLNDIEKHILTHFKVVNDSDKTITKEKMIEIFYTENNPWMTTEESNGVYTYVINNEVLKEHNFIQSNLKEKDVHIAMRNWIIETFALINTTCIVGLSKDKTTKKWELYNPKAKDKKTKKSGVFIGLLYSKSGDFEYESNVNKFEEEEYDEKKDDEKKDDEEKEEEPEEEEEESEEEEEEEEEGEEEEEESEEEEEEVEEEEEEEEEENVVNDDYEGMPYQNDNAYEE